MKTDYTTHSAHTKVHLTHRWAKMSTLLTGGPKCPPYSQVGQNVHLTHRWATKCPPYSQVGQNVHLTHRWASPPYTHRWAKMSTLLTGGPKYPPLDLNAGMRQRRSVRTPSQPRPHCCPRRCVVQERILTKGSRCPAVKEEGAGAAHDCSAQW